MAGTSKRMNGTKTEESEEEKDLFRERIREAAGKLRFSFSLN